jgi:uncharacterized protein (TIGR02246 family)
MQGYDVVERWAEHFNQGDAAAVAALYAPEATLWGTLGQYVTTQPAEITGYFEGAFRSGLKVRLQPFTIHALGDEGVIIAGHYEFSRQMDGQTAVFPARYSFVLAKHDGAWLIAHHHSSMLPTPPAT